MKKTFFLKTFFLLCTLIFGVGSVSAEEYASEWVKANLSDLQTGDVVILVDESFGVALPNNQSSQLRGINVNVSGNKVTNATEAMQWTMTKNSNGTLKFKAVDRNVYLAAKITSAGADLVVGNGNVVDFSYNDGLISSNVNNEDYYIAWNYVGECYAYLNKGTSAPYLASFSFYKKSWKSFTKWKKVDFNAIANDDDLAIVDLTTVNAMSNDKGADADPDLVSVELNDAKDRITGDVPQKIQWKGLLTNNSLSFLTPSNADEMLIGKSDGLRVGATADGSSEFSYTNNFLATQIDSETWYAGVKSAFMSTKWTLLKEEEGNVSDDIKDTEIAFFKKEVSYQKITTLQFSSDNYNADLADGTITLDITCTGAPVSEIQWMSSNTDVATVSNGVVTLKKRGTVVITAYVNENEYHDKASATCTVRIDDELLVIPGSIHHPFTVAQAKQLAENGSITIGDVNITLEEGVNYYVKGMISKVNSGILAIFGDMGLDEMMGDDMDMDEMFGDVDVDMDSMGDSGFDLASMIPGYTEQDGVTYFISDNGLKDNQLKVVNGYGVATEGNNGAVSYNKDLDLSPGDEVVVCGPLIYTEDKNMFGSLMGDSDEDEPKYSAKIGELNYQSSFEAILNVRGGSMYEGYTKDLSDMRKDHYWLSKPVARAQEATFKSSDDEIAKWDADTKTLTAVKEGVAKITVKVKVIVQPKDLNDADSKDKSYTMKRKFQLNVLTRDKMPAGYDQGEYVLVKDVSDLEDGTRLILVGTRTKDDEKSHYTMSANNSTMGGGKSGNTLDEDKITKKDGRERIAYNDVPDETQEIILEKEGDVWYLNVGKDENGNNLYLYASDTTEEETEPGQDPEQQTESGFNFDALMDMFNPKAGLKVATKEAAGDSCKATIGITGDIATIKFPATEGKKNTIMLTSAFDMDEMMNMFNNGDKSQSQGSTSSSSMGDMDFYMAAFNSLKDDDEKGFKPRIFAFIRSHEYKVNIGNSQWMTIVSYYDVTPAANVEAYVVTKVTPDDTQSWATLKRVEDLKGGVPYLLHAPQGSYTMTETENVPEPQKNLLEVSDENTSGEDGNTSVYVLANKTKGVGFYKWTGGKLGKGRVYLPVAASVAGANEFCGFLEDETTGIQAVENVQTDERQFYDLQGRRVTNLKKGVYIVNGQKVIVK